MLPHIIDAVTVLEGEDRPRFPRAVMGAGTGLGHCLILPGEMPVVAGAEAGHALFPFIKGEEAVYQYLAEAYGTDRIENEMAVAGKGPAHLCAYCTGKTVEPHEVAPLAAANPRAMELIARFYGRAVQAFAEDRNVRTGRQWRIWNEAPAALMILIVIMVVVKPF